MEYKMIDEIIGALKDFNDDLLDKRDEMGDIDDRDGVKCYSERAKEIRNMVDYLCDLADLLEHSYNDIDMFNRYRNMSVGTNYTITDDFSFTLDNIYDIMKKLGE